MKNPRLLQWIAIDGAALRQNLSVFRTLAGTSAMLLVVKSNGYGHGVAEVVAALRSEPCWGYGVASYAEATQLRMLGVRSRILVLNYFDSGELQKPHVAGMRFVLFDHKQAVALNRKAASLHMRVPVHLKIDTGTHRIGIAPNGALSFLRALRRMQWLYCEGVLTHFADAENSNRAFTEQQTARFTSAILRLKRGGFPRMLTHSACTAAIVTHPISRTELVRLGIGLYGLWPSRQAQRIGEQTTGQTLQPVLSWHTRILQIRTAQKGESIGYARTFVASKAVRYAVLPVGYWDGYDRRLSNRGEVLIHGKRCRVLGRICMNLMMVDVSTVRAARPGAIATLIGQQEGAAITADMIAKALQTISYDVLTRINPLTPRILQ